MWQGAFLLLVALVVAAERCDVARMKCAYRVGCGMALHAYMLDCADVISGRAASRCPKMCQRALIALTSTEEGQALVECDCDDDEFCSSSKQRVEVCRPEVTRATAVGTVVSCSVAQWICEADPLCSTALEYYHRLCRGMFHGKRCTPRCNNSLAILDRQEKAAKLRTCQCDGSETYPCHRIRENMDRLCFGIDKDNEIPDSSAATRSQPTVAVLLAVIACTLLRRPWNPVPYR